MQSRRSTQRFSVIEDRQVLHVEGDAAAGRLAIDEDGERTALDAVAESHAAAASESRVGKAFHDSDDTTVTI